MIATREQYAAMLDAASADGHALAAINVTSSETLNGAMRGFAEVGADGIIQISTGGAEFASGGAVHDMRCTPTTRRPESSTRSCAR